MACWDKGTRCSFSAFMRSLGIIQTLFLKSISCQVAPKEIDIHADQDQSDKLQTTADELIFNLLSDDNLGSHAVAVVDEFTLGDSNDVIDVSALLSDDANASNLAEFITVDYDAENDQAVISIDRDGSAEQYQSENLVVLLNQPNAFDLADLLANKQIIIG